MYTMLFSKYRERVAAATTARDFANIWLFYFAPLFISSALCLCVAFFDFFGFEDNDMFDLWIEVVDFSLIWVLELWYFLYVFREPDVRFWDPLIYLQKKQPDGLDIEKIRKMHTDNELVNMSVESHIFGLLLMLVFNVLLVLGLSVIGISYYFS